MKRIVCFGPGPQFKGGIKDYNVALAKSLERQGAEVHIVSWTNQYPSIVPRDFIDKTSKTDLLKDTNIKVEYITDYNKPSTWKTTAERIIELKPDIVVFQWAIALQGLPLNAIVKRLLKQKDIEVIFDLHFVIQKEASFIDKYFTKLALKNIKTFITHAYKTVEELKELFPEEDYNVSLDGKRSIGKKNVIKLYHPIYDLFAPDPHLNIEQTKTSLHLRKNVFLFFGFIRKYKGLHYAIKAFNEVAKKRDDVSLLICGESFWKTLDSSKLSTKIKSTVFKLLKSMLTKNNENEQEYNPLALVEELGLQDKITVVNQFIPNEEVAKYFQVSDAVVLFYEYATPSGIESLSYNFKKPLLATKVGHFPETIEDGYNGYLAEKDNIMDMANIMLKYLDNPLPAGNVEEKTKAMSWDNYAKTILNT